MDIKLSSFSRITSKLVSLVEEVWMMEPGRKRNQKAEDWINSCFNSKKCSLLTSITQAIKLILVLRELLSFLRVLSSLFIPYKSINQLEIRKYFSMEKNTTYFLIMCVWHIFDFSPHSWNKTSIFIVNGKGTNSSWDILIDISLNT